ncbi:MAG: Panacea domain-containing protein [candidate division Zixibacteria bacterium]|nr:Panacea domain-containing protein [candidate division Zixibacteria bacterium]
MANINKKKFYNAILFFADRTGNIYFGETKLMKLLYFLDFNFFEKHGKSITGDQYVRWPHGPVPSQGKIVLKEMEKGGYINIKIAVVGRYKQKRIEQLRKFDHTVFNKDELEELTNVAETWKNATSSQIEEAAHDEVPWLCTRHCRYIDYRFALYRHAPLPTLEDRKESTELSKSKIVVRFLEKAVSQIEKGGTA